LPSGRWVNSLKKPIASATPLGGIEAPAVSRTIRGEEDDIVEKSVHIPGKPR